MTQQTTEEKLECMGKMRESYLVGYTDCKKDIYTMIALIVMVGAMCTIGYMVYKVM